MNFEPPHLVGALALLALLPAGCTARPTTLPPVATPIPPAATLIPPSKTPASSTETALADEIYMERAQEALDRGEYDATIADFDRAIALNPSFSQAYLNRGNVSAGLSRPEQALADFKKGLTLSNDPNLIQRAEDELEKLGAS